MFKLPLLLLSLLFWFSTTIRAQTAATDVEKHIPTENIDRKKEANRQKYKPKDRNYSYIYKKSTKGLLYGNPCALEATRKMGFEYVVQKPSLPGAIEDEDAKWNNFLVNLKLIVTRTPFWKLILNKRIRDCRYKSGDIIGHNLTEQWNLYP